MNWRAYVTPPSRARKRSPQCPSAPTPPTARHPGRATAYLPAATRDPSEGVRQRDFGAWHGPLWCDTQRQLAQQTPHEPRRLIRQGAWAAGDRRDPTARVFHQVQLAGEWQDVCEFMLEPMPAIDREVANWWTSAHPQSHFRNRLMAARATERGRLTLLDREFTRRTANGHSQTTRLRDQDELLAVLQREFGIELPASTRFDCPWIDWSAT